METQIVRGQALADYLRAPGVSASQLSVLRRSAAHLRHYREHPPEQTEAQLLGSMIHALTLEGATGVARYLAAPAVDRRTKAGREEWAAAEGKAAQLGVELVSAATLEQAQACSRAIREDETAAALLGLVTDVELGVYWTEAGTACRARLDAVGADVVLDLKAVRVGAPSEFSRVVWSRGYHIQAAHYVSAARHAGYQIEHYVLVTVETEEPHVVTCYRLTEEALTQAEAERVELLRRYSEAVASGRWSGYAEGVVDLGLPAWVRTRTTEDNNAN